MRNSFYSVISQKCDQSKLYHPHRHSGEQAISFVKLNNWGNHVTGFPFANLPQKTRGCLQLPVLSLILFDMDALTLRGTLEGTHQTDGWMDECMDGWMDDPMLAWMEKDCN